MNAQPVKLPPAEWIKLAVMVLVPAVGVLLWVGRVDAKVEEHDRSLIKQETAQAQTNELLIRVIEQIAELRGELRTARTDGEGQ